MPQRRGRPMRTGTRNARRWLAARSPEVCPPQAGRRSVGTVRAVQEAVAVAPQQQSSHACRGGGVELGTVPLKVLRVAGSHAIRHFTLLKVRPKGSAE